MITRKNESKTLKTHISFKCWYTFHDKKCNSNQNWNHNKCWCQCNNLKNVCFLKPAKCAFEDAKCLGSIIDCSVTCHEIIETEEGILTENTSKNRSSYYFDDNFEILRFMTFHIKLCFVQNHCVLYSMKRKDSLGFMMRSDI